MVSFADDLHHTRLSTLYYRCRKKLSEYEKQEYLRFEAERLATINAQIKFECTYRERMCRAAESGEQSIEIDVTHYDQPLRAALIKLLNGHGLHVHWEFRRPRSRRQWQDVLIVSW